MRLIRTVIAAVLVLGLAGCGVTAKINAVNKTVHNLANGTTGDKKLDAMISRFAEGQKAVFRAEFKVTTGGSGSSSGSSAAKPGVYIIAQKPPKSRTEFGEAGAGERLVIIDDGTDSYTCQKDNTTCLKTAGGGGTGSAFGAAAAGFAFLNPTVFIGAVKAFAPLAGVKVDTKDFTKSVASLTADCVTATISGGGQKAHTSTYCTTTQGVLAYSDDGSGDIVELAKYSTNPSDSDFAPPPHWTTDPTTTFTDPSSSTSTSATSSSVPETLTSTSTTTSTP